MFKSDDFISIVPYVWPDFWVRVCKDVVFFCRVIGGLFRPYGQLVALSRMDQLCLDEWGCYQCYFLRMKFWVWMVVFIGDDLL